MQSVFLLTVCYDCIKQRNFSQSQSPSVGYKYINEITVESILCKVCPKILIATWRNRGKMNILVYKFSPPEGFYGVAKLQWEFVKWSVIKPESGRINTLSFLEVKKEDFSYLSTGLSFRLVNFYLGGRKKNTWKRIKRMPPCIWCGRLNCHVPLPPPRPPPLEKAWFVFIPH